MGSIVAEPSQFITRAHLFRSLTFAFLGAAKRQAAALRNKLEGDRIVFNDSLVTIEGCAMHVTLEQAIVIHAKVLRLRFGPCAPNAARQKAKQLAAIGDDEGVSVWAKVALIAETLPDPKRPRQPG
jgi:hypothetical protein